MPAGTRGIQAIPVKRVLLCVLSMAVLLFLAWWGGPLLSQKYFESYKASINRNGILQEAVVSGKNGHKGHSVIFTYTYKGRSYRNREQNKDYYDHLAIGTTMQVMIDSTEPEKSYIFATGAVD